MASGVEVARALQACGVTHVVWIPDSDLGTWNDALGAADGLSLIRVCREGEAFAVAAGLLLAGQWPIVLIQCTGLFEAGDALRNVVHDLRLPLFFVVGVRSHFAALAGKSADSCPRFAEPIVRAWDLPYVVLERDRVAEGLADAYRRARAENRAGAALLPE